MTILILKNANASRGWSLAPNLIMASETPATDNTPPANWTTKEPAKKMAIPTPAPPDKNSAKTNAANTITLSASAAPKPVPQTPPQPAPAKITATMAAAIPAKNAAQPHARPDMNIPKASSPAQTETAG